MREYITAKNARSITDKINKEGSIAVYGQIEQVLSTGVDHIFTNYPLSEVTRANLIERGFTVTDMPQLAIQKDNVYHKVSW